MSADHVTTEQKHEHLVEIKDDEYNEITAPKKRKRKKYKKKKHKIKELQIKEHDPLLRASIASNRTKSINSFEIEESMGMAEDSEYELAFSYLSHKRKESMRTQRHKDQLFHSYRKYTAYNGCKFVIITLIVLFIAIDRQVTIQNHYDKTLCCSCYQIASKNTDTIFEWQACKYFHKIDNVNRECDIRGHELRNLSTKYDRFQAAWYYIITAIAVFIIAAVYASVTICISRSSDDVDILLRRMPLEFMISYNIIISMICFYQIMICYQYYIESYNAEHNIGWDDDEDTNKECYIDALNNIGEDIMFGVLIAACVYTFSPCFIIFPIHFGKKHCKKWKIFGCVEIIYNYIIFGSCGIITITFLGILVFYTFVLLLPHFEWIVWILVILVEIALLTSFIDVYFFAIFKYSRNPFMNIIKVGCCCCYKLCAKENDVNTPTYLDQFRTHSISEF